MKPIIFNTQMVQAILEGKKTQTRRVIGVPDYCGTRIVGQQRNAANPLGVMTYSGDVFRPKYETGTVLWVREAWSRHEVSPGGHLRPAGRFYYKADGDIRPEKWRGAWKPSIHMPKEAARIFLRVTNVRAERVQDISEKDALAEGVAKLFDYLPAEEYREWRGRIVAAQGMEHDPGEQEEQPYSNYLWHGHFGKYGMGNKQSDAWEHQASSYESARDSFSSLWERINAKRGYGWDANPWVWVYEFEMSEEK